MAIRKIVKRGNDALKKQCRPVDAFNKRLETLLGDLADTMYDAGGVGLAAPQVGILRRAVVVDVGDGLYELVNPVITERDGAQTDFEGCLSCPGVVGMETRPYRVTVQAQDRAGETFTVTAEGYLARAFCHELDHLDGRTIYESAERILTQEEFDKLLEQQKDAETDGE